MSHTTRSFSSVWQDRTRSSPLPGTTLYEYGSNTKFSTIISPTSGQRVVLDHFKFVARIQDGSSNPPLKFG